MCLNSQAFLLWGSTSLPPRPCITTLVTLAYGNTGHPLLLLNYGQVRIKLLSFLFPKKSRGWEQGDTNYCFTASSLWVLCLWSNASWSFLAHGVLEGLPSAGQPLPSVYILVIPVRSQKDTAWVPS